MVYLVKLRNIVRLSLADEHALISAADQILTVARDRPMPENTSGLFVIDGWAGLVRSTSEDRPMILQLALPGDLIAPLKRTDARWVALTYLAVLQAPAPEMSTGLTAAYEKSKKLDCLNYEGQIARCGFMAAEDRMIDLFVELDARSSLAGHSIGDELEVPLTQSALGQILGLTSVHVNRMRRALVDAGRVKLGLRSVLLTPELQERSRSRRAAYIDA